MWRLDRARIWLFATAGVVAGVSIVWLGLAAYHRNASATVEAESARRGAAAEDTATRAADDHDDKPLHKDDRKVSEEERARAITRAQIWRQPAVTVRRASLAGALLDELSCRFKVSDLGGTTPKFDCELQDGEEVRIKYGNGPEVPAEAAATRLLTALGFAADAITLVRRLRCYGCPKEPFSVMKAVEVTKAEGLYKQVVDYTDFEVFEWVGLERRFAARPIETDKLEGWSFFELDSIDPTQGGAPRSHVDAMRMIAVLLAHWDNKSENQRLVCLSTKWPEGTPCQEPLLMLQDVGATFGPPKLDLAAWEKVPMWDDRLTCTVSMRELPFEGATFGQARITEAGRKFTLHLLSQLSDEQLTDLFTHARFAEPRGVFTPTTAVADWVRVFKAKVQQISAGPPCPLA